MPGVAIDQSPATGRHECAFMEPIEIVATKCIRRERGWQERVGTRGVTPPEETLMLRKILIAGAVTLGLTAPTLAAEFYVVQDTATKKCTIVDKKPTVTTSVVVGDGKVYTTRTEAETGMKTVKVCTN
jgi:hypothetical protein